MTNTNHYSKAILAALAALALATSLLVQSARPAEAAFPGANGKIVFASNQLMATNPTGDSEIFAMNPNGTGLKQLTFNTAYDRDPVLSKDGKRIAFESLRDGNNHWEIYKMDADGSNQTRLTYNTTHDELPSWSPDGKRIAFQSDRDGNWEIYRMRPTAPTRSASPTMLLPSS
jgi:Tol biopolymer transport system component